MTIEKAFIHLFRTPGGYYIYDVNTNVIVKVSKELYEYLQAARKSNNCKENGVQVTVNSENQYIIKKMKENGLLLDKRVKEIVHPADNTLEYYLSNKLPMIILQVTQQCNLRCEYCVYSGNYMNRGHANVRMTFDTAKRAIEFLIDNSRDVESVNIGFYGGEPLLEFELIKKCINYAQEISEGKTTTFSFTTNGTILTKETIEFFQEHDVSITISLDGPAKVHDANRKFAVGGCGTFDKISKNLEFFRENYPDYFKKVGFNVVLDTKNDFSCVSEFFTNYETLKDSTIRVSDVADTYAKFEGKAVEDYNIKYRYELFKLYLSKVNRLDEKHVSRLVIQYYDQISKSMVKERFRSKALPDKAHHGGPCIPGGQRLFVDANGNFYPCERVSEDSEVMCIGNVDRGFDIEKVRKILNVGKITSESCINCWAIRFCSLCAAAADDTKKLSQDKKLSSCIGVKAVQEQYLKTYCTLNEFGYRFNDDEFVLMEV